MKATKFMQRILAEIVANKKKTIKRNAKKLLAHNVDYLQQRAAFAAQIAEYAENGMVAVIQSGMDCDGVRYDGVVSIIPANVLAFNREIHRMYDSADGPCEMRLQRPSVAKGIKATSRDLGMEAFEDGHAHVIYG